jgi:hypothetical protein
MRDVQAVRLGIKTLVVEARRIARQGYIADRVKVGRRGLLPERNGRDARRKHQRERRAQAAPPGCGAGNGSMLSSHLNSSLRQCLP